MLLRISNGEIQGFFAALRMTTLKTLRVIR
jgi:hypothetical protein